MQNKVYLLFGLDKIKSSQAQYDSKLLLSFSALILTVVLLLFTK